MALSPEVIAAKERMNQAEAELRADAEGKESYDSGRRRRLLRNCKRAMDEYLEAISRMRP
jgi:hypothetical protein